MSNQPIDDLAPLGELVPGPPSTPMVEVIEATPMNLLRQAMDAGMDPVALKQFMDLADRHEANEARKAYAEDMVNCQAEMPKVMAQVEGEKTNSYYAKMGHINQLITPIYTGHGFSISFGHGKPEVEGEIRTTARVLHKFGHYEDFFIDLPPDVAGAQGTVNKTAIHGRASSNTYGQRYIVKGIFNLSILSEDDDANAAGGTGGGLVEQHQAVELQTLIDSSGLKSEIVLREFGVQTWELLPAKKFDKAYQRITKLVEARK